MKVKTHLYRRFLCGNFNFPQRSSPHVYRCLSQPEMRRFLVAAQTTRRLPFRRVVPLAAFAVCIGHAVAQECSTEKVNNSDCNVTIDRSYPVVLPTIQMHRGKKVKVKIMHPLPFEILSLDLQTAQAVAGTDQTAAFVTATLPNLKGLVFQTEMNLSKHNTLDYAAGNEKYEKYKKYLASLKERMDMFTKNAAALYAQLNEVLGPIAPDVLPNGQRLSTSKVLPRDFPQPWIKDEKDGYPAWRHLMQCEIAGQDQDPDQTCPDAKKDSSTISALLAEGLNLAGALGPCSPPLPSDPFQSKIIACQINALQSELASKGNPDLSNALSSDSAVLSAGSAAIVAVNKDLSNFLVNIQLAQPIHLPDPLAYILDPKDNVKNSKLPTFLGRQVAFVVNAVNEVANSTASITTPAQKKSIVTITVLYADPIFEVSAGAFFSTLANRSFANQTIVTQNPGAVPTLGNVVITQTITRPTIVPFAAANWRLGRDFAWPDHRRGAFYFTAAIGLNPNNATTEFGVGPSFSWRALMFSPLFHWGHDVRLTQGEQVGEIFCNMSGTTGSIPKCSGGPPNPSTQKFWTGAFAFGIGVRVPSVFPASGSSGSKTTPN